MENLFLLPILFLVVSCSSNKMEKSEQHQEITTDLYWNLALAFRRPIQWT